MQSVALQVLVVVMMLAVGLELTTDHLAEAPRRAGWFGLALIANLVVVPVGAWLLADALGLSVGLSAGLVLLAASPGGPVGPVLGKIANADLGFSTALMVLLGIAGLVSAPLTVSLLLDAERATGDGTLFWPMFQALLLFQIVPLAIAMATRHLRPALATQLAKPAGLMSNVLLVAVIVGLVFTRGEALADVSAGVHGALIAGLLVILAPTLLRAAGPSVLRGLSVVTAVRNISVALLLAASFFDDPEVEVAILVCAFWMLVLPGVVGVVARRFRTDASIDLTGEPSAEGSPGRMTDLDDQPQLAT